MTDRLVLVADGRVMGEVRRHAGGRLALAYDPAWRALGGAWPLSLSMPLIVAEHEHGRIEPWLRRLLPDDDRILERWGRSFNVAAHDVFGLLAAVGEDCAGAVQIVRPDRLDALRDGKPMTVEWLTRGGMAERLRALRRDHAAWRQARDPGQCSLAGAQTKTALFFNGQHWGVPSGRTPTTHILKPPAGGAVEQAYNAQLCLALARALGLPAADARIMTFEDQVALAVKRYDRVRDNGSVRRLHQENLGQALGLSAAKKNRGRDLPVSRMVETIRAYSSAPRDDVWTLAKTLLLNWLIAGADTGVRRHSILIGADGQARLAPLHDLSSTLLDRAPDAIEGDRADSANAGEPEEPAWRRWSRFAAEARLPATQVLDAGRALAAAIPDALRQIAARARADGTDHPAVTRLVALLSARAERCEPILAA